MSKRKRIDFEEGVQSASGTVYNGKEATAPNQDISYDDPPSPPPPELASSDSSFHAGVSEQRQAPPAPDSSAPQQSSPSTGRRRLISYVDDEAEAAVPEGPYSYVAEKKLRIYYSGGKDGDNDQGQKRPRHDPKKKRQPRMDDRFGQIGAFPEPENTTRPEEGETDDYDAASDGGATGEGRAAWEYLRAVREEAQELPGVLSAGAVKAKKPHDDAAAGQVVDGQEEEGDEDYMDEEDHQDGLCFEDGVCYAAPPPPLPEKTMTAQDLYYQVLCKRFESHRARIRLLDQANTPVKEQQGKNNSGLKQQLDNPKDLYKSQNLRNGRPSLFNFAAPSLQLLAGLDNQSVLALVSVLDADIDEAIGKQENLPDNIGAWVWYLLGRLADKGSLWSEEIVMVRDLAKRAGWALAALKIGNKQQHRAGSDDQEIVKNQKAVTTTAAGIDADMEDGEIDEDPVVAATDEQNGSNEAVPNHNTMATLHTIITIAGEFYGQRDLLDARLPWFE